MPDTPAATLDSLIVEMKAGGLLDPTLEAAFRAVPRVAFLPQLPPADVYRDEAIAFRFDEDGTTLSSSSQPSMMAIMLRQLDLKPGHNVLEIGAGTGYNAALMQHLVGDEGTVTTIELDAQVAEIARANLQRVAKSEVLVVTGDGAAGYAPRASYDRIIATAGIWDVPETWVRQLKPGGILVTPLLVEGFEISAALTLQPDGTLSSSNNRLCGFIPLRGQAAVPDFAVRIATSGLYLYANHRVDSAALQTLISDDASISYLGATLEAWEYWLGFLPYLVLHVPADYVLARYQVSKDAPAYGIDGGGFVLMSPGSACFVSVTERGMARSFGSSDAIIAVETALQAWERDGKPQADKLRLRLVPTHTKFSPPPDMPPHWKVYPRRDHTLLVWMQVR